jgi:hypothetical protein
MPFFIAVVIEANEPWVFQEFVSPKTVFWASQNAAVIEFPETPEMVLTELGIVTPFWT